MAKGLDYAFKPHPTIAALKAYGAEWVGRYVSSLPVNDTNGKNLIPSECKSLLGAGIGIILFVEEGAEAMKGGRAAGVAHAQHAVAVAKALGMDGIPFYYAADWDAAPGDQAAINAYMDGAVSVHGVARAGIYGGYYVVKRTLNAGKARFACQTMAWSSCSADFVPPAGTDKVQVGGGFRLFDQRAQIRQGVGVTVGGASCDADESQTPDYGQWPRPGGPPAHPPKGFHGEWITKGQLSLAQLAATFGLKPSTLLRMTAVHYGQFGPELASYVNAVHNGTLRPSSPLPAGSVLWVD